MRMAGELERRRDFGYALSRAMDARDVSARELKRDTGIDDRKINAWRNAASRTLPDVYQMRELAALLGVEDRFFTDPPTRPPEPDYPIAEYLLGAADRAIGLDPPDSGQEPLDPPPPAAKPPQRPPRSGR